MRYRKVQFGLDAETTGRIYTTEQSRYPWLGVRPITLGPTHPAKSTAHYRPLIELILERGVDKD